MMSAIDCQNGGALISDLAVFSRYRERKLVSQFRQHIRTDDSRQFPGLSDCDIQSLSSPNATSVHSALHAEVVLKHSLQAIKIATTEALRFEEDRALSPVAGAIIHEPDRERLRICEQRADCLRDNLLSTHVEQSPKFRQARMAPCYKSPERIPTVVVIVQRGRVEFQEFLMLPRNVRLETRCVIHLEPDTPAVRLKVSIP
jgi:hypothetical protein